MNILIVWATVAIATTAIVSGLIKDKNWDKNERIFIPVFMGLLWPFTMPLCGLIGIAKIAGGIKE